MNLLEKDARGNIYEIELRRDDETVIDDYVSECVPRVGEYIWLKGDDDVAVWKVNSIMYWVNAPDTGKVPANQVVAYVSPCGLEPAKGGQNG